MHTRTFAALALFGALAAFVISASVFADMTALIEEKAGADEPSVTLLSAGSQPRSALRYTYTAGEKRTYVFSNTMVAEQSLGSVSAGPPQRLPEVKTTLTLNVDEVDDEGNASCTLEFTKIEVVATEGVHPMIRQQIERSLAPAQGLVLHIDVCRRGIMREVRRSELEVGEPATLQAIADIQHSVKMLAIPLPEEPVGPGARWKVDMDVEAGEIATRLTSTYELREADQRGFKARTIISQTAGPQTITDPASGQSFKLESMRSESEGAATVQLQIFLPSESEIRGKSTFEHEIDLQMGHGPQMMQQIMRMHMTFQETTDEEKSQRENGEE